MLSGAVSYRRAAQISQTSFKSANNAKAIANKIIPLLKVHATSLNTISAPHGQTKRKRKKRRPNDPK
jgi:hypothetical protein